MTPSAAVLTVVVTVLLAAAGGLWALSRLLGKTDATLDNLSHAIADLRRSLEPIVTKLSDHGERISKLEQWREDVR